MTTRAMRFLNEALPLIGEQAPDLDPNKDKEDPTVIDDTAGGDLGGDLDTGGDDLGLGAEPEDEFGLGASSATPSVRIEKDGPITVNKGDVELTIGDDGNIDITLDGGTGDLSEPAPTPDLNVAPEGEETPEEDDYKIDWDKEKEGEGETLPKEGLEKGASAEPVLESKARQVLNMKTKPVLECIDSKYECMSCGSYDECQDKMKKAEPKEDESDFLTQGYL